MQRFKSSLRNSQSLYPYAWILCLFFVCLFCVSAFPLPISASVPAAPNCPDYSRAQAVIVYNADFNEILLESNADKLLYPASTVKIMTGYLASELLKDRMDETVTVTEEMLSGAAGNRMKLAVGEEIRIRDLFYGAVTGGYNDACKALAVLASGSESAFVSAMNHRASALGMDSTVYKNPTGLHDLSMVTTARDTLTLSLAASTDPLYMAAASAVKHEIPATNTSDSRMFYNRNYLIASAVTTAYHNPYVEGLNAGMTDEGGWCVAAKAFRFDLTWFCVVLGGEESEDGKTIHSYEITNNLLSWAARGYKEQEIIKEGAEYARIPVEFASITSRDDSGYALVAKESLSRFLPVNTAEEEEGLAYRVLLHTESLIAPFPAGHEAGTLVVTWNGEEVGRVPLITSLAAERNSFTYLLSGLRELPKNRIFLASLIAFLFLTALYILRVSRRPFKKRPKAGNFVPAPFRHDDEDETAENQPLPPPQRKPNPPPDPYASAADALERRKPKK